MSVSWREEPLTKKHNRTHFDCGNVDLNTFLQQYARQAHDKGTSKTYLAINNHNDEILGFYTIALNAMQAVTLPEYFAKNYGQHPLPVFTLARLAIHKNNQGKGLGGQLLLKAAHRCFLVSQQVGGIGLFIEAKDKQAAAWYESFGAVPLLDKPLSLLLPFKTVQPLF